MPVSPPVELHKENLSLRGKVRDLEEELKLLRLKVRVLEMNHVRLPAKPEDENQLHLEIQHTESVRVGEEEAEDTPVPQIPSSSTKRRSKPRIRVDEKFEKLPVLKETVLIPQEVKKNPEQWEEIGSEVVHEVVVQSTELGRHRIVRKKFRNKFERETAPIIAKAPVRFSSSYASISLAVYIAISKYLEHGPLYRLEKKFARLGADIPRQSQSDIVERMSMWIRPLYELIDKKSRESAYLQIDETFIKYINGNQSGVGQGYFWAVHAPGLAMVYKWIPNRRHGNVERLVGGFHGILQSDGYAAYSNYARENPAVVLAACWSHAFRKFRDALEDEPHAARDVMKRISELYKLEEKWDRENLTPDQRLQLRAEKSIPMAEDLKGVLTKHAEDLGIPKNAFRSAITYTLGQWEGLMECLRHGHTKLDTNLLESKFRPAKIGEKNWMFIGHPQAGSKSAILYTMLTCCRIHRIEPRAYLTDILEQLVPAEDKPPLELLESLLPWNWKERHPEHLVKEPPQH